MYFIAGTGHCGTKWLSKTLTHPEFNSHCFHEFRNSYLGIDWIKGISLYTNDGFDPFGSYFSYMNSLSSSGKLVGDSNSWSMEIFYDNEKVEKLSEKTEIERIIFLIRDGIKTANSNIMHNRKTGGATIMLNRVPGERMKYIKTLDSWEEKKGIDLEINRSIDSQLREINVLIHWAENYSEESILKSRKIFNDRFEIHRLEDLTSSTDYLDSFLKKFGIQKSDDQIKKLQNNDVNRKIKNQNLDSILSGWDRELKDRFLEICSDTMKFHEYNTTPLTGE